MFNPQIHTFIKVVECRSFSKAADALFLSRIAVMRHVNTLEEKMGVRLLDRNNTGITPTPAGEFFYRECKRLVIEAEDAVRKTKEIAGASEHVIRVGASLLYPCQPIISLWDEIRAEYPAFKLKIVPYSDDSDRILEQISMLGNNFDMFFGLQDSKIWNQFTEFLQLRSEPLMCAVPITHPLASRTSLKVTDFDGYDLMMVTEGDSPGNVRARAILTAACPSLRIHDVGNYYDANVFTDSVERNCLLLSCSLWENIHPLLVTIPIEWDCAIPCGIVYARQPTAESAAFIEIVRTYMQGDKK